MHAVRTSQLGALLFAAGLVGLSSVVVAIVTPTVPVQSAGVFYLVGVLGASSLYGLGWGLATSVASALAFNFFFLPPAHTLAINSSSDWLSLGAFVATALVTSNLAARERRGRDEAARRAAEATLGEAFATLVATADDLDEVLPALADQAARALGAEGGHIVRGAGGPGLPLVLNERTIGVLQVSGGSSGALESPEARRVAGNLAGLLALGEERERRQRAQVTSAALARSDELKTALLRAVSHDLRSPLMAITAAAGGLRYANLDDDERELQETIVDEGARMSRMVDNLLDLSRLQAGALQPADDWLDPRELVEAAVEGVSRAGPQSRIRIELGHDVPLVRGDDSQLERVIVNLVENALKFSPTSEAVHVSVAHRPPSVEIAVSDHGPGIAAADAERIFEPFYRSGRPPGVAGSGLGLAIARGLAAANGCTLRLETAEGSGSRFVLAVPAPPQGAGS